MADIFEYIDQHHQDFVETLIKICEVPAPPFQEQRRAEYIASTFRNLGFNPTIDSEGNVIVPVCENGRPHVVLSAHLDTVFPFSTITVERQNSLLRAPGISDDSAGLAALLLLCKAWRETGIPEKGTLTMVATVGEEGLGNLRGAKHFFETNRNIDYFISLDGCDPERLVIVGLASKRVRIFFRGPGGHSWGDAGKPNPIHISGELLSRIHRLNLPESPKTTINVGTISGGTSINTIPTEVFLDIDLRSESAESLQWLDSYIRTATQEVSEMHVQISSEIRIVGDRPSGSIAADHPMVLHAIAANAQFGLGARLDTGSTDANIPFALGIPALTMGVGGKCGKIHTPEEWYDIDGVEAGLKRTALLATELLKM